MSRIGDSLIHAFGGMTPAEVQGRLDGMKADLEVQLPEMLARASGAQQLMTSLAGVSGSTPGTDIAGYAGVDKQMRSMSLTPWVYKAVDMIAKSVATTPLYVKRRGADAGSGDTLADHPLVKLLEHPNPHQTASEFKTAVIRSHRLTGIAFIYKLLDGAGQPVELWPIRPDRVEIEPDQTNFIRGYWVTTDYRRQWLYPEQVIRWCEPSPFNDYWGLSPIQALAYTIESDAGARRYTDSFYRNQARLAGALVADSVLAKTEVERLKNLYDTEYKGPQNAWKMAFLFGGLKYVPFGVSQADMQIIETLKLNKEDILTAAFGIPMGLVSENATEANALAAYNTFANWTLYPLLVSMCEKLTTDLAGLYGSDIYVEAQDVRPQDKAGKLALLAAIQQGTLGPDGTRWPLMTDKEIRREWLDAPPFSGLEPDMLFTGPGGVEQEETPEPAAEPQPPVEPEAEADEEPARQRQMSFNERITLGYWQSYALESLRRGKPHEEWNPPGDVVCGFDPLTRQVIRDLLAGAETEADIEAVFREALGDGETYP